MYRSLHVLPTVLLVLSAGSLAFADWPQWRGPAHDGISPETDVRLAWTGSPAVLWEREIGSGFSSMAAVGDRVYTCGTKGGSQVLYCLEADSGKVVWEVVMGDELEERQGGDGPRATPTVNDGKVYVLGAFGNLLCVDAATGRGVWKKKFDNKPTWAYSGSVLVEGDLAVVSPGKQDGGLLALDKRTGRAVWSAGDGAAGYATPYPFTFRDRRLIAGFLATEIIIVEARSGRLLWSMPWKTSYNVNAATPIYHDGHLFVSSGYGTGCALVKLGVSGGKLTGETVWKNEAIRSKFQTCVLYEGHLYGADEQGLKCVEFKTGKVVWDERRVGRSRTRHGTVLLVDGHLLYLTEAGHLYSAKASPDGFRPRADTNILSGRCWTVPTLHDGLLYARNLEKLVCVDLRE